MKKTIIPRFLTAFLVAAMTFHAAIPALAQEKDYSTISGTVSCADPEGFDASVDVSEIEVKAVPLKTYSAGSATVTTAAGEYFPVEVDGNGAFSFEKTANSYWVDIVIESLPKGYGANRRYVTTYGTDALFTLRRVESIDISYTYGSLQVNLYDRDGKELHANYEVIPHAPEWAEDMKTLVGEGKPYSTKLDYIDSLTERVYAGRAVCGNVSQSYRYTEPWNSASVADKLDAFYEAGVISREEYLDMYCHIIMNNKSYAYSSGCFIMYPAEKKHYDMLRTYISESRYIPPELAERLIETLKYCSRTPNVFVDTISVLACPDGLVKQIRFKTIKLKQDDRSVQLREVQQTAIRKGQNPAAWTGEMITF